MVKTTPNSPAADHISRFCAFDGWDAAIVIPAKDEAERIVACLTAAALSASRLPALQMSIVLVVNNSSDATAAIACDWAVRNSGAVDIVVVEKQFSQAMRGVGAARRFGLELAVEPMTGNGVLLMTDADTIVSPTWVGDNLAELHGADIVCGRIDAIPEEQAALPVEISQHGSWESDYVMTALELSALLDPLPHDPRPAHHNGAGASMAFTSSVYQAVGGMPTIQIGEDRAFVENAEAMDYRIRYSNRPIVYTSCRMNGRTDGGRAGALRERRDLPDPPSDEWLEPAATFYLRYHVRGALRKCWPIQSQVSEVVRKYFGTEADQLLCQPWPLFFGQLIRNIETDSERLKRVRMTQSDCRRELPHLQRLHAQLLAERELSQSGLYDPLSVAAAE